jgi:hypothetical protein
MEHSPFTIVSTLFGNCVPSAYFAFQVAKLSWGLYWNRPAQISWCWIIWKALVNSDSLSGDLRALNYEEEHFSLNLKTILNIAYIL